jgi:hypothetical protein
MTHHVSTTQARRFSTRAKKASFRQPAGATAKADTEAGWKCCKPRVLTFDEFLSIPPCTTGKHSTVDDTPKPPEKPKPAATTEPAPRLPAAPRIANPPSTAVHKPAAAAAPASESDSDDPALEIARGTTCRRRGCECVYDPDKGREGERCVHHPGHPLFHEGNKSWTCCKKRVLDFDEFLRIEGCTVKDRHMFVGKAKKANVEEKLETVR